jgi:TatA/E family protein of Tat protein translocase
MTELLVILVVGLLVLGPKRLPELARSLGRGLAEFRRASTDMRREFLDVKEEMRLDDDVAGAGPSEQPKEAAPDPGAAKEVADAGSEAGHSAGSTPGERSSEGAEGAERPGAKAAETAGG